MFTNRKLAIIIARRNAAKKTQTRNNPVLAACIAAGGFAEHRAY